MTKLSDKNINILEESVNAGLIQMKILMIIANSVSIYLRLKFGLCQHPSQSGKLALSYPCH